MLPRAALLRRHPKALGAVALAFAALLALGILLLYAKGGGPLPPALSFLAEDPLPASTPAETALRTLRLAGYDRAVVGEEDGVVVVRVEVPSVASSADVELSWQTALAVGAEAYPDAKTCVAQLFGGSQALLEVKVPAESVRSGDATSTRAAAEFRYLSEAGGE